MTKGIVPRTDEIIAGLGRLGWKKNGYQYYLYMDRDKRFLCSVTLKVETGQDSSKYIAATVELHSVCLNELSNFIWDYDKPERAEMGLFRSFRLPVSAHLRGPYSCPLYATAETIKKRLSDVVNPFYSESFTQELQSLSNNVYQKYSDLDNLINLYETQMPSPFYPALPMYIKSKDFEKAWGLFRHRSSYPPGPGDLFLGAWHYLKRNNLGVEPNIPHKSE